VGDIRIKTSDKTDKLIRAACDKLGLTQAELARVALMNFLKDMKLE
jgi:hypothetical protein